MQSIKHVLVIFVTAVCLALAAPCAMADSFAITNVRVFDGQGLSAPRTVVVENGVISKAATAATVVDGAGGVLLPGLMDTHVHLEGLPSMENAAQWGVTAMFDMGTPIAKTDALRNLEALPYVLGSGVSAAPKDSLHTSIGCVPLSTPEEARDFVKARADEKADFIKVIADSFRGQELVILPDAVLDALVKTAHENKLRVIAHVTQYDSIEACYRTNVDIITHLPLGKPVDAELAGKLAQKKIAVIPTLVMMQCFINRMPEDERPPGVSYQNAEASLTALYKAGVTVMGGTDANSSVCLTPHGSSLHDELQRMVNAGLSPVEALRSVTVTPVEYFDLKDFGAMVPGRCADFVLVEGDPTQDISATQNIKAVWIGGIRVK